MSTEQTTAEEAVADILFGPEETPEETPVEDEEYQPDPKPVEEGEEAEPEEVEAQEVEEVEGDPIVEFEWNGQLIEAPTSIKDSLMLQQDYTQKTQDLAASRKELEVRAESINRVNQQYEFAQSIQKEVLQAHQMQGQIDEAKKYLRSNVGQGDDLSAVQIEQIRLAIDEQQDRLSGIVNSIQSKSSEFQQAQEQSLTELLNKSTEVLRQKVPGWGDSQEAEIKDYALSQGIPEQTYNSVVDPLEKLILYKAMQYDALQQAKPGAVKKVQDAPTIKRKSRNPMPKGTQDKLNLRKKIKNPNKPASEKATAIGEHLADRFGM